jgi:hypothetical protein
MACRKAAKATCKRNPRVVVGATWTTDAPFRETAEAIEAARRNGILGVEMEAAALYTFARSVAHLCFVSRMSPIRWARTAWISRRAQPTAPATPSQCWKALLQLCIRWIDVGARFRGILFALDHERLASVIEIELQADLNLAPAISWPLLNPRLCATQSSCRQTIFFY